VLVEGANWAVVRPRIEIEAMIARDVVPQWIDEPASPDQSLSLP
jgi:hypothetical protein